MVKKEALWVSTELKNKLFILKGILGFKDIESVINHIGKEKTEEIFREFSGSLNLSKKPIEEKIKEENKENDRIY